jgi:hypothetical protein
MCWLDATNGKTGDKAGQFLPSQEVVYPNVVYLCTIIGGTYSCAFFLDIGMQH